jgi:hypothetical protein
VNRLDDLRHFYDLLGNLERHCGGMRTLRECTGRLSWPERGVYFFFEAGEFRRESGNGPRVVRVGTHALSEGSRTSLWKRLSQHAGRKKSGSGNHRGSIFRLLVGEAIMRRDGLREPASWGRKGHAGAASDTMGQTARDIRASESALEKAVSDYVGRMPFLFVSVDDAAGPASARGVIERNAIALLSNYERPSLDPPSATWLGLSSGRERVTRSGLWNNNHVDDECTPQFLATLAEAIRRTTALGMRA